MAWEQILGFFTMWLHPEITIGLWYKAGVPFWQTLAYTAIWTSLTLSFTYWGIAWLKEWLSKRRRIQKIIEKLENWYSGGKLGLENRKYRKKMVDRLIRQKSWMILTLGFVPFVYGLPAAVIIVAKLLNIRHALFFLLLGNVFRSGIICLTIYGVIEFFF